MLILSTKLEKNKLRLEGCQLSIVNEKRKGEGWKAGKEEDGKMGNQTTNDR
jgi:hypothetical protein